MKQRTVALLVTVCALGAGAALYWENRSTNSSSDAIKDEPIFAASDMGKVDEIDIKSKGEHITLKEGAGSIWTVITEVEKYPADAKALLKILDDLSRTKIVRVVGDVKENDPEYSATTKELILKSQDKEIFHWYFADSRASGGAYAYKDGEKKMLLISDALRLDTAPATYESKLIFKGDEKLLSKIVLRQRVTKGKKVVENEVTLARATAEEKFKHADAKGDSKEIPEDKQTRLLSALKELNYQERVSSDNAGAQQALDGSSSVDVYTFDNKILNVMLGKFEAKDKKEFYLKIVGYSGFDGPELQRLEMIKNWSFKVAEANVAPLMWSESSIF